MQVRIFGAPRSAGFALFVIQQPPEPFGASWYQTDVNANSHGNGRATVRGIFDVETFSVSPGGTTTFAPTHRYHSASGPTTPASRSSWAASPGSPDPS